MKRVAILGGGPAGAFAAERLARAGLRVTLYDEKLAWEKPCGGGLTHKAYKRYPFLLDGPTPKRVVRKALLASPGVGEAELTLEDPLLIYSRLDLNRMLLERAGAAGAQIEKARVSEIGRDGAAWTLRTSGGAAGADFCIVATGARNPLRQVGTQLTAVDSMPALGYYVPGEQEHVDIQFLPPLEGYIWVFPRCGHLAVGICAKAHPAGELRKRLEQFMTERGMAWKGSPFYGHVIPSLEVASWRDNRVAGDGWMAVGDAAGLVDPVTGEGIYYALRSADLASSALLADNGGPAHSVKAYRETLRRDFATELEFGARLVKRMYQGQLLKAPVIDRMLQFTRRSPHFASIMQDLFAGRQPYTTLKRRLLQNINGGLYDLGMSLGFSHLVPRRTN